MMTHDECVLAYVNRSLISFKSALNAAMENGSEDHSTDTKLVKIVLFVFILLLHRQQQTPASL